MASTAGLILADGSERPLAPGFSIGRADDNDLRIEGPTVSRHHAIVTAEGDRWFLEDRGSFNGTSLNGSRIQPGAKVPLRHGDRIGLGAESVVFSAPGSLIDPEVTTALQAGPPALRPAHVDHPPGGVIIGVGDEIIFRLVRVDLQAIFRGAIPIEVKNHGRFY